MENTLILLQKIYDTFAYLYQTLQLYPKSEKYALAAETKKSCIHVLELAIRANKKYYKKTTLQDADVELELLRYYIRLGYELQLMSPKRYEQLSLKMAEVGRLLGGMIKQAK